ncbi:MAG: hypothetical protein AAB904_00240 [Patescibacteria group bacterium]
MWEKIELELLKNRLMRRVYTAWFVRKVLVPAFVVLPLGGYLLLTKIAEQNISVLWHNIMFRLANFDLAGFLHYSVSAVRYTEMDSLLIGSASLLVAAFFAAKLLRDVCAMMGRSPIELLSPLRWRR